MAGIVSLTTVFLFYGIPFLLKRTADRNLRLFTFEYRVDFLKNE